MSEAAPATDKSREFDTEFLFRAPEIYVFSACSHIVEQVVAARVAADSGAEDASGSNQRVKLLSSQLWGLAVATQRFDIIVPLTTEGTLSPFFWRWFNWWQDYRKGLTAQELDQVHDLLEAFDPSALDYRPSGDWLSHRATAPTGFKIPQLKFPQSRPAQSLESLDRWGN